MTRIFPMRCWYAPLEPLEGIDIMLKRTGKQPGDHTLTRGPGNLAKAWVLISRHRDWNWAMKKFISLMMVSFNA